MTDPRRPVYAWLLGQDDNIGDSILRREYANALRTRGPIVAYIGWNSPAYISGLELQEGDRIHARFVPWALEALRASRRGPVTIGVNAGEFALSRLYAVLSGILLPVARAVRRRGGTVVWLGAAVPAPAARPLAPVFDRLVNQVDLLKWRDSASSEVLAGAPWMPDWALAIGSRGHDGDRRTLGVSLRGDRPYPSSAWIAAVRDLAAREGLEPVAIAQVERDSEFARRLAADLGGRALEHRDALHSEQEARVRDEYRGMRALLSDRLHGLLVAATEGAVPLAWCEASTVKMARHLEPVGLGFAVLPRERQLDALAELDGAALDAHAATTHAALERAKADIADVVEELRALGAPAA